MERSFLEVKKTVEFVKVADGYDIDNILIIFSRVLLLHLLLRTHTHTHTSSKKGTFIPDYFLFCT